MKGSLGSSSIYREEEIAVEIKRGRTREQLITGESQRPKAGAS
jgi:hypothetical protein